MLVLSRKVDERIIIGGNIEITIVRIFPNVVRLGIKAPADVSIQREEIADRGINQAVGTVPAATNETRPPHLPNHAISRNPPIRRAGR